MGSPAEPPQKLRRELGLFHATLLGLGSILGTGVFVSIGIAAGITGASVTLAVFLAAFVALFNGSSSAQLAAAHPVSGGTYEYGYRFLSPTLGFLAGWMFLLAKSASAATAALGLSGYVLNLFEQDDAWLVPLALTAIVAIVLLVLRGIRRSSQVNTAVVTVTILALGIFVVAAAGNIESSNFTPFFGEGTFPFFEATALMFVAYTGYGRIATLGEEVHHPRRTIPRAIGLTLLVTAVLYVAVAIAAIGAAGADAFASITEATAAPLEAIARGLDQPTVATLVALGAVTAMLGVLLNLVLGLSRVLMAMGRRGDMPTATAQLDAAGRTPWVATIVVGLIVAVLALTGDIRLTWTFSALNVLVYYALTNAAALQLPTELRILPRWLAWAGLVSCSFLTLFIDPAVWLLGAAMVAVGLVWHRVATTR